VHFEGGVFFSRREGRRGEGGGLGKVCVGGMSKGHVKTKRKLIQKRDPQNSWGKKDIFLIKRELFGEVGVMGVLKKMGEEGDPQIISGRGESSVQRTQNRYNDSQ